MVSQGALDPVREGEAEEFVWWTTTITSIFADDVKGRSAAFGFGFGRRAVRRALNMDVVGVVDFPGVLTGGKNGLGTALLVEGRVAGKGATEGGVVLGEG